MTQPLVDPPGSGKVRFLANSSDPRPGKEGTVYGAGHETNYDSSDHEFIKGLLLDGKAELISGPTVADFLAPPA